MIYAAVLVIQSWLRWLVLLAGIAAFVRAASGAATGRGWTPADDRAGFWFSIALDVQFLLGLILHVFLSPITHAAFSDFAGGPDVAASVQMKIHRRIHAAVLRLR